MAFKPRPPKTEEAKEPAKAPKPYKVSKAADPDIPPAQTFEELDERVIDLMKLQVRKSRPSDLRRRVEYIEAVLRKEGLIPDADNQGIQPEDASPGEAELQS